MHRCCCLARIIAGDRRVASKSVAVVVRWPSPDLRTSIETCRPPNLSVELYCKLEIARTYVATDATRGQDLGRDAIVDNNAECEKAFSGVGRKKRALNNGHASESTSRYMLWMYRDTRHSFLLMVMLKSTSEPMLWRIRLAILSSCTDVVWPMDLCCVYALLYCLVCVVRVCFCVLRRLTCVLL